MKDAAPAAVYLSDYTPPAFLVERVDLTFRLHPTATRVLSRIAFRPNPECADRTFRLDGENLMLVSAKIDGQPVTPEITPEGLTCPAPSAPFLWEAEVEIAPEANTALEGLYMSRGMYCTQCEAQGFRKITFYPDRPDVMAPFHVRIEGDAPVLLSNGNPTGSGPGLGRMGPTPGPSPPISSPSSRATLSPMPTASPPLSGREVALNVWVRPGDEDRCDYAMDALKRVDALGRGGLRPRIRPRRLQHRRGRRFQHGRHGEQGPQHLQLEVCAGLPRNRDRRRLRDDRRHRRPRILPQLDRQPHHLPRLVPALPQGRPDRLPRPAVHRRPALATRSSGSRTSCNCARRQFPEDDGPLAHPVRPDSYRRDQQLLHRDRLREGRRNHRHAQAPAWATTATRKALDLYFAPPRRRGGDHRGLAQGLRGRHGPRPRPVPPLVRAGRHPPPHGRRGLVDGRPLHPDLHHKPRPPPASPTSARRSSPSPWASSTPTATRSSPPPSSR